MEEEKEAEVVSGKANLGLTHRKSQKHKLQIKFSYLLRPQGQPFIPYQEASPVAQRVKNLPAMQETWVRFLGWEDPLEKEMATHSSIVAWKIPWTEESGGLQSMGSQRIGHD